MVRQVTRLLTSWSSNPRLSALGEEVLESVKRLGGVAILHLEACTIPDQSVMKIILRCNGDSGPCCFASVSAILRLLGSAAASVAKASAVLGLAETACLAISSTLSPVIVYSTWEVLLAGQPDSADSDLRTALTFFAWMRMPPAFVISNSEGTSLEVGRAILLRNVVLSYLNRLPPNPLLRVMSHCQPWAGPLCQSPIHCNVEHSY